MRTLKFRLVNCTILLSLLAVFASCEKENTLIKEEPLSATALVAANRTISPGDNIQNAINQINNAGGGVLTLEQGTYTISSSIRMYSNITMQGDPGVNSYQVTIKPNNTNFNEPIIYNDITGISNVVLKNFKVRGNIASSEQNVPPQDLQSATSDPSVRTDQIGILFTGGGEDYAGAVNRNITIEDLEIRNCSMGMHLKGTRDFFGKNLKIHQNGLVQAYFHNVYLRRVFSSQIRESNLYNSPTGNGINVSQSNDISLKYNNCYNNYFRGLRVEGEQGFVVKGIDIFHNNCYDNGDYEYRFANINGGNVSTNSTNDPNDVYILRVQNVTFKFNDF